MEGFIKDMRIMAGQLNGFIKELPQLAGAEMLDSVDDNFRTESFFGAPWAPRVVQKGNDGRAILVQTGYLRRSLQLKTSGLTVTIFTDAPYAEIHNEGGTIQGAVQVEAYTRHVYNTSEVQGPKRKDGERDKRYKQRTRESKGTQQVRAHTRNVHLEIPQRQFMGEHPELDSRLKALIEAGLDNIFEG
jgi:phage gpG-like protein